MSRFTVKFLGGPMDGGERSDPVAPRDGDMLAVGPARYVFDWGRMAWVYSYTCAWWGMLDLAARQPAQDAPGDDISNKTAR